MWYVWYVSAVSHGDHLWPEQNQPGTEEERDLRRVGEEIEVQEHWQAKAVVPSTWESLAETRSHSGKLWRMKR